VSGGASDALAGVSRSVAAQKAVEAAAYAAQREAASAIYKAQASSLKVSMDSVRASLDAVGTSVGKLKSLSGALKGTLDGMRIAGSEGAYRAGAQAQISAALATARAGGGLPVDGQLESALRTVSQPSEQLFASFTDYARDFYRTANDISALNDLTDSQLTADQATQAALTAQLDALKGQSDVLKDGFAEQVSALDDILSNAQRQLDAANGINTSVLTVAQALAVFNASIMALTTERARQDLPTSRGTTYSAGEITGGVKAMLASGASVSQIYDTGARDYGLGASAITAATSGQGLVGFDAPTGKKTQDYSQAQISDSIKAFMAVGATPADVYRVGGSDYGLSPSEIAMAARAAGIPGFAVGTNYVPRDMLAMVHQGESITPRAFNPAAGGANGNGRLEALLERLTQQVAELAASSERGNAHIARGANAVNGQQPVPLMVQIVNKNGVLV
jgi:prefoldin subunit 5